MPKSIDIETDVLVAFVCEHFIAHGKDLTIAEIAEVTGWKESKIRRIMTHHHGCPDRLICHTVSRASFSKDYPSMQAGAHNVTVYGPSRDTLRKMLTQGNKGKTGAH